LVSNRLSWITRVLFNNSENNRFDNSDNFISRVDNNDCIIVLIYEFRIVFNIYIDMAKSEFIKVCVSKVELE